jgi:hypothetical protein
VNLGMASGAVLIPRVGHIVSGVQVDDVGVAPSESRLAVMAFKTNSGDPRLL